MHEYSACTAIIEAKVSTSSVHRYSSCCRDFRANVQQGTSASITHAKNLKQNISTRIVCRCNACTTTLKGNATLISKERMPDRAQKKIGLWWGHKRTVITLCACAIHIYAHAWSWQSTHLHGYFSLCTHMDSWNKYLHGQVAALCMFICSPPSVHAHLYICVQAWSLYSVHSHGHQFPCVQILSFMDDRGHNFAQIHMTSLSVQANDFSLCMIIMSFECMR